MPVLLSAVLSCTIFMISGVNVFDTNAFLDMEVPWTYLWTLEPRLLPHYLGIYLKKNLYGLYGWGCLGIDGGVKAFLSAFSVLWSLLDYILDT